MYQHLLGLEHPLVATSQCNLGAIYQKQCRYAEAEDLYRQSLAIAQSKLGSNHPHTQGILNLLNSLPQPFLCYPIKYVGFQGILSWLQSLP